MKNQSIVTVVLTAALLVVAGCASTPTRVSSGPIQARSFSFVNRAGQASPSFADNRQPVHTLIQNAIVANLAARGLKQVQTGGDLTVGYLVIVGNNASVTSINDYFGYSGDQAALLDKAHTAYTKSENPNYFEAGTLVIDLVDSKTFKLRSRGYVSRPILRDATDAARADRIRGVVDEILRDVKIVP